jgi:LEA14-like dessication related protein
MRFRFLLAQLVTVVILTGCAGGLGMLVQEPNIQVTSIALRNTSTLAPEFDITLRVSNPNAFDLKLVGMSYSLDIEGNRVLSGVSNKLPTISAYGDGNVNLNAVVSLMASINLLRDLAARDSEQIDYEFNTTLDAGGGIPRFNIRRSGQLPLQ